MQTSTFDAPGLFGDHHVTEVRRILLEIPGVKDVYASSAFRIVQVTFNEKKVKHEQLAKRLEELGYLGDIPTYAESGIPTNGDENEGFYRHTAVYETTRTTVSFSQKTPYLGRPLWNCPGLGVLTKMDE
jgi:copper chaperone CopZ